MSFEGIVNNLSIGLSQRDVASITFAGIDTDLANLIKPFARKRNLDISKVRPELKNRAKRFAEYGVISYHKQLPRKIRDLIELRRDYAGLKGIEGIKQTIQDLGFFITSDFKDKNNLIAILEGYGYISEFLANENSIDFSKVSKVFSGDIKIQKKGRKKTKKQKDDYPLYKAISIIGKEFAGTHNFSAGVRELGFRPSFNFHSEESIKSQLMSMWPHEKVKEAYEKNDPTLLMPWREFTKNYISIYGPIMNAAKQKKRKKNGKKSNPKIRRLKKIPVHKRINELYPDFPDLFNFISVPTYSVNKKVLAEQLKRLARDGVNIYSSHLSYLHKEDNPGLKKIFNQIEFLAKATSKTPSQIICELTKTKKEVVSPSAENRYLLGLITEEAVRFTFLITKLIDGAGDFLNNGFDKYFPSVDSVEPRQNSMIRLNYSNGGNNKTGQEYILPDFLVSSDLQNRIVEVRAGSGLERALNLIPKFHNRSFKELEEDNTEIVIILQMPENIVEAAAPILEEQGLKVMSGKTFFDYFSKAVRMLERSPYRALVANAVPNKRHSLANLIKYHKRIIEEPHILMRDSNKVLLEHHYHVLFSIVANLQDAVDEKEINNKPKKYMHITSVLHSNGSKGKIDSCVGGRYFRTITPVTDIKLPTAKYLRRHLNRWKSGKLRNHGNKDYFIPLKDIFVLDIENTGLRNNAPIFLNGIGYFNEKINDFVFEGLFARDYYEEEAILTALFNRKKDKPYVISFNGSAFDLPRLEKRYTSHSILCGFPREHHLDIMHAMFPFVKQYKLENSKLTTLEVALHGFTRPDDDVAGRDIPRAYWKYLDGGDPEPLGRVLKHNMMDVIATVSDYAFLLKNPRYFNENCLEKFRV